MFDIGMPELIVILIVAVLFIRPKKLPGLARSLGRSLAELKRAGEELKDQIDIEASLYEEGSPPPGDLKAQDTGMDSKKAAGVTSKAVSKDEGMKEGPVHGPKEGGKEAPEEIKG